MAGMAESPQRATTVSQALLLFLLTILRDSDQMSFLQLEFPYCSQVRQTRGDILLSLRMVQY